jgi:hypothetical protein
LPRLRHKAQKFVSARPVLGVRKRAALLLPVLARGGKDFSRAACLDGPLAVGLLLLLVYRPHANGDLDVVLRLWLGRHR